MDQFLLILKKNLIFFKNKYIIFNNYQNNGIKSLEILIFNL